MLGIWCQDSNLIWHLLYRSHNLFDYVLLGCLISANLTMFNQIWASILAQMYSSSKRSVVNIRPPVDQDAIYKLFYLVWVQHQQVQLFGAVIINLFLFLFPNSNQWSNTDTSCRVILLIEILLAGLGTNKYEFKILGEIFFRSSKLPCPAVPKLIMRVQNLDFVNHAWNGSLINLWFLP